MCIRDSFFGINIIVSLIPLLFQLFYPKIGTILGIASSISALFMIYIIPVQTYFKMRKLQILYPMLAAAIEENEVQFLAPSPRPGKRLPKNIMDSQEENDNKDDLILTDQRISVDSNNFPKHMSKSPKIVVSDRFLKRNQSQLPNGHIAGFGGSTEDGMVNSSDKGSIKQTNGIVTDGVIPVGVDLPKKEKKKAFKDMFINNASSNNEQDDALTR